MESFFSFHLVFRCSFVAHVFVSLTLVGLTALEPAWFTLAWQPGPSFLRWLLIWATSFGPFHEPYSNNHRIKLILFLFPVLVGSFARLNRQLLFSSKLCRGSICPIKRWNKGRHLIKRFLPLIPRWNLSPVTFGDWTNLILLLRHFWDTFLEVSNIKGSHCGV